MSSAITNARLSLAAAGNARLTGRQALALLWASSRPLSLLVALWVLANALIPAVVVVTLGAVVADVPAAGRDGFGSPAGHALVLALAASAVAYAVSLVLSPLGGALGTSARARITGALQGRLLRAVSAPVGITHLEDPEVLDRLARAEGTLTGFFPGDAPVTWAGVLASRLGGIVGCVAVAAYHWWLGLLLLVIWVVVRRVMVAAVVRQATEFRGQTATMRRAWYFTGLGSKAAAAKEIRVFGLAGFVAGRFRTEFTSAMHEAAGGLRSLHRRAACCFAVVLAGYAVALLVLADDAAGHRIGLAAVATLLPMFAVTMSTGSVTFDDVTLAWTLAGLPDVDELEEQLVTGADELAGRLPVDGRPRRSVRLEGVRFRYPEAERDVLTGVDLELPAGTSTAIVGVNGAGKTTLVSLLSRLRDPTAGRLSVDGVDVRELDPAGWQRTVAVVFQDPVRYPVTAYRNIAFGALEHQDDAEGVRAAAEQAGFLSVVDTLPRGWDTVLCRELPDGVDLSGGQWQRLSLARALFATRHGARLLVLDEPTAALDVRSEAAFYDRFLDITRDLTTVVISHRFATVRRAGNICVLDGGRITERGSHEELVAAQGTYASMYALQAARFGDSR